ncbi:MAG: 16S rRNA processing protein RimM [Saprospirales bacterium]|nr:MAG: 16S rRNA processing protein RimM [Saprospirales bacterium]
MARLKREMEELIPAGRVLKPYGKDGSIKLAGENEAFEKILIEVEFIFITDFGSKVPFRIEEVRPGPPPIVKLEGLDAPETARRLNGAAFFLLQSDAQKANHYKKSDPLKYIVGFEVIDQSSEELVGKVINTVEMAGQLLAEVEDHKLDKIHLIPIHEDMIISMDPEAKTILMELPEGLTEL